jgi:Predicted dehydrogenases and related proteins
MIKKIKIGQIGIGHNHGEAKMQTVRKFSSIFEVVGVAEPDEEWLKKRKTLPCYADLPFMSTEELLNTPGLDAVLVETDVKDLMKTARICIEKGVPIHLDKPAGEDFHEFKEIMETARSGKIIVQMAYMYRYNPAIQCCIEKIKRGEIGTITHIDAQMSTEHSDEYRRWLQQFQGGSMYIFGCHLIDLVVLLLGEPEKVIPFLSKSGKNGVEAYDNNLAVLTYKNGSSVVRVSSVEVNGFGRRQFVICGTEGTLELKPFERPTVMTYAVANMGNAYCDRKETVILPECTGRYDEQLLDFAKMVRGEKENPFSYDHELLIHQITLKACGLEEIV